MAKGIGHAKRDVKPRLVGFAERSTVGVDMHRIVLKLSPEHLDNPDLDIRYQLPDLLQERSGGIIRDDGCDYAIGSNDLYLFVTTADLEKALTCIRDVIENTRVLDNDLRQATIVAIEKDAGFEVVFPTNLAGSILSDVNP